MGNFELPIMLLSAEEIRLKRIIYDAEINMQTDPNEYSDKIISTLTPKKEQLTEAILLLKQFEINNH